MVAVSYLSIDPAMRWIDATYREYREPVEIGAVMEAGTVGRVTSSEHPGFAVGEHVYGGFGVQDFARSDGTGVTKLDPLLAPLPTYLGAPGTTGLTAYFGLLDVGRPGEGDTVVVSGAAGAVGSVAGQIAKIKGCRVIGIAGGPEKCRWITGDLGFDAAIDYKAQDIRRALQEYAPTVSTCSSTTSAARFSTRCSPGSSADRAQRRRLPVQRAAGPRPVQLPGVDRARALMTGMLTPDYADRYIQARAELAGWLREGRLISREDILEGGVRAFPDALPKLFAGENIGKLVLAVP